MNYKEYDQANNYLENIVKLGKWAYDKIPDEAECGKCPLLKEAGSVNSKIQYYCAICPTIGLCHTNTMIFKGTGCPKHEE